MILFYRRCPGWISKNFKVITHKEFGSLPNSQAIFLKPFSALILTNLCASRVFHLPCGVRSNTFKSNRRVKPVFKKIKLEFNFSLDFLASVFYSIEFYLIDKVVDCHPICYG